MKVLIFGASGMVGQGVLRECLLDNRVIEITSVSRSGSNKTGSKLTEIRLPDLNKLADVRNRLAGFDACFFCLGVSSIGVTEDEYTSVTFNLTMVIAAGLMPCNPSMTLIYVTGAGTSRNSRQMWARVKARTEDALRALPFNEIYIFRPGFIQPVHGAVSKTRWVMLIYSVTRPIMPILSALLPSLTTTTERVGRAMIHVALQGYHSQILENNDINAASDASSCVG